MEILGSAAALAAALVPVVGALVRWVGFGASSISEDPFHLALAAPTGELVVIGLWNTIPYFLGLAVLIARHEYVVHRNRSSLLEEVQKEWQKEGKKLGKGGAILVGITLVVGLMIYTEVVGVRSGVVGSLRLIVFVLVVVAGIRIDDRRVVLGRSWPVIIVLVVMGGAVGGLGGDLAPSLPISYYRFAAEVGPDFAPDGWYVELGDAGDLIYLHGCSARTPGIIALAPSSVRTIQFGNVPRVLDDGTNPSLWQATVHQRRVSFGIRSPCPRTLPPAPRA